MEKRVDSIIFRRLTYNDFDKINQQGSAYKRQGGGQGYIDFPTKNISIPQWRRLLGEPTSFGAQNRPKWLLTINSLAVDDSQKVLISNRRAATVSITSQKLPENSSGGNRIFSWHPDNSFPVNYNPDADNLVVYIVKADDNSFWAGWFLENRAPKNWIINNELQTLFDEESAGIIVPFKKTLFDTKIKKWPFYFDALTVQNQVKTDDDVEEDLLNQDTSPILAKLIDDDVNPEFVERIFKIRKRNNKIVKELKKLYRGKCQISGDSLTFEKKNGELYSEVHHLISLGEEGSDSYANTIVVSPLIHRMLHYANVSDINLSKIENYQLTIQINGSDYQITWHPEHAQIVEKSVGDGNGPWFFLNG